MKSAQEFIASATEELTRRNEYEAEHKALQLAHRIMELRKAAEEINEEIGKAQAELKSLSYKEVKPMDLGL